MPRQYLNCYIFLCRMHSSRFPARGRVSVRTGAAWWLGDRKLGAELSWGRATGAVFQQGGCSLRCRGVARGQEACGIGHLHLGKTVCKLFLSFNAQMAISRPAEALRQPALLKRTSVFLIPLFLGT